MARATSGGLMAFAWTAVIFGAAFVVCLILAILFYNQREDAVQKQQAATNQLSTYVNDSITTDPKLQKVVNDEAYANRPVVQALVDYIADVEKKLSETSADLVAAENKVETLQAAVPGYQQTIQQRELERDQQGERLAAAQARVDELRTEMQGQLDELETERKNLLTLVNARGEEIGEQLTSIRQDYETKLTQRQQAIEQKDDQLAQAKTRITELEGLVSTSRPEVLAYADARITQVGPDRVLIDIGRRTGLQLGMNFEVFGPDQLVRVQDNQLGRGKASIEIIGMEDNIATGRIVRREQRAKIQPGDEVLNIVFDPTRTREFVAYGDFDSNGDGQYGDTDGEEWIKSLVRRYEGEVGNELKVSTDFLVMGKQPEVPEQPQGGFVDPEEIRLFDEQMRQYNEYVEMLAKAQSYGVPVLNQGRFLELVGYYDRNAPLPIPGVPTKREGASTVPLVVGSR